jgi:hypothetical protein
MSSALASARNRRAPKQDPPPLSQQQQQGIPQPTSQQQMQQGGLTLPQVISLVDKRLSTLEKHMNESKTMGFQSAGPIPSNLTEVLDEFNSRHDLLANEIGTLKNLVMNLQSYTMDVNKMLLKERVKILSDLGGEEETTFSTYT